jgi:hypothetical protein
MRPSHTDRTLGNRIGHLIRHMIDRGRRTPTHQGCRARENMHGLGHTAEAGDCKFCRSDQLDSPRPQDAGPTSCYPSRDSRRCASFPRVAWRAPQPLLPPQLAREPRSSCRFRSATLFPPQAPQAVASDEEYEMQHLGSHTTVEGQYWKMHAAGRQYSLRRRISLGTCDRGKDSRKKSAGAGAAAGVAAAAEATAAAAPAPGTGLPQVSPQAELTERAACPERMQ